MEPIISLLTTLNGLSPLAIIGLLGLIIYKQIQSHAQVNTLKTNDLHELPDVAETLRRIEVTLTALDSYLRAKLNGKP